MRTPIFLLLPAPGCCECVQTSKRPRGTVFHAHRGLPAVVDTSSLTQVPVPQQHVRHQAPAAAALPKGLGSA